MKTTDHELTRFNALKGRYKHYCHEWHGLAIDEHSLEFLYCYCCEVPRHEREIIDLELEALRAEVDQYWMKEYNDPEEDTTLPRTTKVEVPRLDI